ncbi:MAG: DUF1501 domain-containing protein [Bryobacteraceae bacterium]|nr:DUF1501 domain-containing protein [Bryobacteraceae bacterium]
MRKSNQNCDGHAPVTRRHLLFGAATAASAGLLQAHPDAEVTTSRAAVKLRGTARCCIFINLNGAPSHLDLFNPQDGSWNPRDVDLRQGPGGMVLSNRFFPNLSRITNDLLVLRSVQSWENAHERGQFYMQTGHTQNPAFAGETPHIGAVISREKGANGLIPPFMSFNQSNLQGATFLGGRFQPLMPPAQRTGISTLSHNFFGTPDQSRARFDRRFRLLENLDTPLRENPVNQNMADYASFYAQARRMMYNDAVEQVFQYGATDEGRYGNTTIGRSLIIARNAVNANNGAVFINVTMGGWDLHDTMFDLGRGGNFYQLSGELDRAVGALVEDLRGAGTLDSTLIVMMGEFGRTPGNLNSRGGRDHHKDAMCAAMIGGGVKGGRALGKTDGTGARVTDPGWREDRPMYTEDIATTIYSALGVDYTKSILDTPSGRRYQYVQGAEEGRYTPIEEVWG